MNFDDDLADDGKGKGLEESYSSEYNAMENKKKAERKKQKMKHAYKADARIWNDETQKWVKKLDRNRGSTCTLTMLFTEFNYIFDSEEGRKRLKTERMEAKKSYESNEQNNNKHANKYPDKYCLGSKLPAIKGNFFRLMQMFEQYIYDEKDRMAAATREKNAMRHELAKMRKPSIAT